MQLRLPPVSVRWAIGLIAFIAIFAWYTAPNPVSPIDSEDPFVGRWLVNGVDSFGMEYSGSLAIRSDGDGYGLEWIVTGALISGTGNLDGDVLEATWTSGAADRAAAGSASYTLVEDELIGVIRTDGTSGAGTETAERLPGG